ncbi:Glu-tRNA(Gln) amidotransferase subunit GatD [Aeropyrum pernix]|uniref:Glu-tRNA(Gln) amidotransferase subunit GatD n=1 Tax=Aeropyrum pernix TaxID=56636 RepID=UPI0011E51C74|nr:Glu-tRNA(Gln) amidotransferase subunit GatD [Aeropyrum pernix]
MAETSSNYYGYKGVVAKLLSKAGAKPGDVVEVRRGDGSVFRGVLMPKHETSHPDTVVIKLGNGYNIGVLVGEGDDIVVKGSLRPGTPGALVPLLEEPLQPAEERVYIIGAGGTIASRVDYETGAVKPYLDASELATTIPELQRYASIEAEQLFSILSEDMKPSMWEAIVDRAARVLEAGYDGVVVAHGTDTMAFTASALSFAFHKGLPSPVILTGSQRSSDRPSSDAAFNLTASVLAASRAPFAEVAVVMHGETGDTYALAHRGVRVKKMHSSRRDAFQSVNDKPLARIYPFEGRVEMLRDDYRRRGESGLEVDNGFEERVALVKHFPGLISEVIDALLDRGFKGIVVEGTGFGHVSSDAIKSIERARDQGVPIVITTQTVFGRVNLNVYSTGRKMLAAGAIPAGDMTSEAAYAKLSWILARTRELEVVRKMFQRNLAGEVSERHILRLYRHIGGV